MANHTPGPWNWVVHDKSMATLGVLPDPGLGDPMVLNVQPCKSCAERSEGWVWGLCGTPSIEDAMLISAAPDLLAAIVRIVDEWEPTFYKAGSISDAAIHAAEAAIAKATGETE